MLERVFLADLDLSGYQASTDVGQLEELRELARPLRGAKILHVNATPYGGGVAEILRSEVPLLRSLGLVAEWHLIRGDHRFFAVTKAMHNGLQGADGPLAGRDQDNYREHFPGQCRKPGCRSRHHLHPRSPAPGVAGVQRGRRGTVGVALPYRYFRPEPVCVEFPAGVLGRLRRCGVHDGRVRSARSLRAADCHDPPGNRPPKPEEHGDRWGSG